MVEEFPCRTKIINGTNYLVNIWSKSGREEPLMTTTCYSEGEAQALIERMMSLAVIDKYEIVAMPLAANSLYRMWRGILCLKKISGKTLELSALIATKTPVARVVVRQPLVRKLWRFLISIILPIAL